MNISKKILALIMAFTMVFGLSVTAFADTTKSVQVTVTKPATASSDAVSINTSVNVPVESRSYTTTYTDIENMNVGTAYDAVYLATNSLGSSRMQYMEEDDEGNWVFVNKYGLQIESVNGISQESTDVITQVVDGVEYHTATYGYWNLTINGSYAPYYSTRYTIDNVSSVGLTWDTYTYNYTRPVSAE